MDCGKREEAYEAPILTVLGTVEELTLGSNGPGLDLTGKTIKIVGLS